VGAGYDTRLVKFRDRLNAECYELDQASTQEVKRKAYSDAVLDVDWIHFVPVDFTSESWSEKLLENGFDPCKKTFWLWEGVTLYLEESIVRDTLAEMDRLSAADSRIAFDFYSLAFVNFEGSAFIRSAAKQMLKAAGEPLKFGIDTQSDVRSNISNLLEGTTLSVKELALLGRDQSKAFAGIAEVVKGFTQEV
jgi:methyltransferase (TIGR00027 family)